MENKFTPELIEKAKSAKTPEELMALAKENGMELTEESAKAYFVSGNYDKASQVFFERTSFMKNIGEGNSLRKMGN